ncbi:hypothetical protein SDC9_84753 [bioreactor metagenome]|uniref:Uncharacterized protein n=1 Tax=bioreactor metagenome TaxID=1076179 RepID=A0A644ZB58_9ZZZZ
MVGFEAFKHFQRIVQNRRRWVDGKWLIRHDARVMPSQLLLIIRNEHVIGKHSAKAEGGLIFELWLFA